MNVSIYEEFDLETAERKLRESAKSDELHRAIISYDILRVQNIVPRLSKQEINARDRRGNPPLHLAIHIQSMEMIQILLDHNADVTWKNGGGWSAIQEAIASGNRELLSFLIKQTKTVLDQKFEQRIPHAISALSTVPDFYMEVQWEFASWVPFVSKLCPSDTYRLWKKGRKLRVDTTLAGFENFHWTRGAISYLFCDEFNSEHDNAQHFAIVNHEKKKISFVLEKFKKYSIGNKSCSLNRILNDKISRTQLNFGDIDFVRCKSWLGYEKSSSIGIWKDTKEYNILGVDRITESRIDSRIMDKSPRVQATDDESAIDFEEYFNGELDENHPKGVGLMYPHERKKLSTKSHKAKVWLTDKFPLTIEQLLPIIAIVSPNGKHFEKVKELISVHFPNNDFPVKIELPVFPTIYGTITFNLVEMEHLNINDDTFAIPSHYTN